MRTAVLLYRHLELEARAPRARHAHSLQALGVILQILCLGQQVVHHPVAVEATDYFEQSSAAISYVIAYTSKSSSSV